MLDIILAKNSLYNKYPAPELYTLTPSQYHTESLSGFLHCTRQNLEHRIWLMNMGFWSCNRVLQ